MRTSRGATDDPAVAQDLPADPPAIRSDRLVQSNEAARAREKLDELLAKYGLNWIDIPACIAAADADDMARSSRTPNPGTPSFPSSGPEINVLDLVLRLLELHVAVMPEERMA